MTENNGYKIKYAKVFGVFGYADKYIERMLNPVDNKQNADICINLPKQSDEDEFFTATVSNL